MKTERAREIATSPVMANVEYNGSPVYIEKVNEINNTAYIHLLSEPKDQIKVPVTSLIERK
ncbi:small acid-soluble spore protein, H-type [Clostridiales bacterium oral taxon 876 str. F0540]|nr:small acid-soluble spore protein, H-type [Clostridiales bacterium oral taxon 876 str. F0540]